MQTLSPIVLLRSYPALFAILLLALLIRLALWAQPLHQPANDELEYITVAYDLLAGRGWSFYDAYHWLRAPLYPLFLAGSLWLAGGNLHLAALPTLALSVANVLLVYLLTRELAAGRAPGAPALAALLAALLLTLSTFASLYMSETLFSFLFTLALLLLLRWRRMVAGELPAPARFRPHALALLAGVCYGLAVLTRSLPLAFLPVLLLWMLAASRPPAPGIWRHLLPRLGYGLLLAAAVLLTIAPWTLRNCRAYGRCILVETGFSYNMWAFNEPHEGMETIFRTLEAIPNPAERADEATQRGMQRLREDPAILLRKLYPNWIYIWRVKPIQDRFLQADYYADPPPLVFLGALLLDDLLYVLVLLLGVVGFTAQFAAPGLRWRPMLRVPALLPGLWIAYVVAASMLTHGEARYRHFFFLLLISLAAPGLLALLRFARRPHPPGSLRQAGLWVGCVLLLGALLHTVLVFYPWQWASRGAGRSLYHLAGDVARARGDLAGAEAAYRQARAWDSTADVLIALGDVRQAQGDTAAAEKLYRRAWRKERLYIPASARLGALLRAQGRYEEARDAFEGNHVAEQRVLDWSWQHLPTAAPSIDVGNGLDFGSIGGMYPAEQQQGTDVRWTNGRGLLRLALPAADTDSPAIVRLRLAAPHPGSQSVPAHLCAGGRCQAFPVQRTWRTYSLLLPPPTASAGAVVVELRSPVFSAPDGRQLGLLVDWAAVYRAAKPAAALE